MDRSLRFSFMASATVLLLGVGGAQAQQVAQAPNMSFFVTSAPVGRGGDLGGLAGADAHCQQLAATAGAGGKTWRAYLDPDSQGHQPSRSHRPRPLAKRKRRRDRTECQRASQR